MIKEEFDFIIWKKNLNNEILNFWDDIINN
jgi:hypothetical protein